jgi:dTDP-4-amino-4,6-dideoxygalactose transaminase
VVESGARDALRDHLAGHGIATAVHYPVPIHRTRAYALAGLRAGALPVAEDRADRMCSLPMHAGLDADEIARIADAVHSFSG